MYTVEFFDWRGTPVASNDGPISYLEKFSEYGAMRRYVQDVIMNKLDGGKYSVERFDYDEPAKTQEGFIAGYSFMCVKPKRSMVGDSTHYTLVVKNRG